MQWQCAAAQILSKMKHGSHRDLRSTVYTAYDANKPHLGLECWECSCRKTGRGNKSVVAAVAAAAVAAVVEGAAAVVEGGATLPKNMKNMTPRPA